MAGSNDYVIKAGAGGSEVDILGQLDGTMTLNGAPVETTNKSSGGYIEYLDAFMAGKQIQFAGNFNLINEAGQNTIKGDIESGLQADYTIETGVGGESWTGKFVVSGRSDGAPLNGVPTMAVTFMSSGEYTYTAPTVTP